MSSRAPCEFTAVVRCHHRHIRSSKICFPSSLSTRTAGAYIITIATDVDAADLDYRILKNEISSPAQ